MAGIYRGPGKPGDVNQFSIPAKKKLLIIMQSRHSVKTENCIHFNQWNMMPRQLLFLLNLKNDNAFNGCRKCTTRVTWSVNISTRTNSKSGGRVVYPELNAQLRTDSSDSK